MTGLTQNIHDAMLKHLFKIEPMTVPTNLYALLHVATALTDPTNVSASQIVVDHLVSAGATITINPVGPTAETWRVRSVIGAGPYTLTLEDNQGEDAALDHAHASGEPVKFSPAPTGSDVLEPMGQSYARVQHNDWAAPSAAPSEFGFGGRQTTNSGNITWPRAEDAGGWGLVTHVAIADAASGGNILAIGECDEPQPCPENTTLRHPSGGLRVILMPIR